MDTIWLKIVGFAVLVVGVIVLIGFLTSGTKEPEKTIYDQWEQDDKGLLAEPEYKEPPAPTAPVQQPALQIRNRRSVCSRACSNAGTMRCSSASKLRISRKK